MERLYSLHFFLLTVSIIFFGCTGNRKEPASRQNIISSKPAGDIHFHELGKLSISGDFDGDGLQDTLYQHNFSRLTHAEIDSSPDPYQNDWDTVSNWFNKQDADVYLAFNQAGLDTLHLGIGQGLYCLINIGDNNADGKDEIAVVSDYFDMSRVNTCNIYSLCRREWTSMKEFGIHEGAFDFTSDTMPVFKEIEGFLVKKNNQWMYSDYNNNDYNTAEEVGKMKRLTFAKCDKTPRSPFIIRRNGKH